jgi:hypothetical protein
VVTYDGSDLDREVERVARLIEASTIGGIATITELTDQSEPLGVEEQTSESEPTTT